MPAYLISIHAPTTRFQIVPPIHNYAGHTPSIARLNVGITSTANEHLQGHPFQKSNQGSSTALAAPLADSKIILDR